MMERVLSPSTGGKQIYWANHTPELFAYLDATINGRHALIPDHPNQSDLIDELGEWCDENISSYYVCNLMETHPDHTSPDRYCDIRFTLIVFFEERDFMLYKLRWS